MSAGKGFQVDSPVYRYHQPQVVGPVQPPAVAVAITNARLTCLACGTIWDARDGRGPGCINNNIVGGPVVECMACDQRGALSMPKAR